MPTLKTRDFAPSKKKINFDHLHNNQINFIPTLSSQVRSATLRSSQFRPSQKNKSTSVFTLKTSNFQSAHKNKVNFDPHKNQSISVLTLKPSQFLSPTQSQVNFDPNAEVKPISIPTLKTTQLCTPPDTKIKLISIQTPNQVIFDPHTKPSQF